MNLNNPLNNWYTDTVDIYREQEVLDKYISRKESVLIKSKVPCRVYKNPPKYTEFTTTSAEALENDKLACHPDVDIIAGDKLVVTRGGRLGKSTDIKTYFAGMPSNFYEPFGGIRPRINHKEVPLGSYRRV